MCAHPNGERLLNTRGLRWAGGLCVIVFSGVRFVRQGRDGAGQQSDAAQDQQTDVALPFAECDVLVSSASGAHIMLLVSSNLVAGECFSV